jgi:hypothetical protein
MIFKQDKLKHSGKGGSMEQTIVAALGAFIGQVGFPVFKEELTENEIDAIRQVL